MSEAAAGPEARNETQVAETLSELPEILPTQAPAAAHVIEVVKEKLPRQSKQSGGVTLTGDDVHDTLCRIGLWLQERAVYPFPRPTSEIEISVRLLNTDIDAFKEGQWPKKLEGKVGG